MNIKSELKNISPHVMFDVLDQISKYNAVDICNEYQDEALTLAVQLGYIEDITKSRYNNHAFEKGYNSKSMYLSNEGQKALAELIELLNK